MMDRVAITKALLKGDLSQREIAEKFHVSIAKISRGSNALKTIDPSFKEFLCAHLAKNKHIL